MIKSPISVSVYPICNLLIKNKNGVEKWRVEDEFIACIMEFFQETDILEFLLHPVPVFSCPHEESFPSAARAAHDNDIF